jgi:hypothetical protein
MPKVVKVGDLAKGARRYFTPRAIRTEALPLAPSERAAAADEWMQWMATNSARPSNGTPDAVPSCSFDFPVVNDPLMFA